jgi:hypothetical protein
MAFSLFVYQKVENLGRSTLFHRNCSEPPVPIPDPPASETMVEFQITIRRIREVAPEEHCPVPMPQPLPEPVASIEELQNVTLSIVDSSLPSTCAIPIAASPNAETLALTNESA